MGSFSPRGTFHLPNLYETFSVLPDNGENPHCEEVLPQSRAWINQYTQLVCGPKMCKFMDNCMFERCMSFFYPYASPASLRAVMDLVKALITYSKVLLTRVDISRATSFGSMTNILTPTLVPKLTRLPTSSTVLCVSRVTTTGRGYAK